MEPWITTTNQSPQRHIRLLMTLRLRLLPITIPTTILTTPEVTSSRRSPIRTTITLCQTTTAIILPRARSLSSLTPVWPASVRALASITHRCRPVHRGTRRAEAANFGHPIGPAVETFIRLAESLRPAAAEAGRLRRAAATVAVATVGLPAGPVALVRLEPARRPCRAKPANTLP